VKIATLAIAALAALTGCVTLTDPVPAGPDTYMIGLGARGGFTNDAELLAQTIKAAGAFCRTQHRIVAVQSTNASGVQGWTPQSNQVFFKCSPS
jgi:hypothetical protein